MAATNQEITDLMQEHEIIRAHMKFLINSLSSLVAQSSQGTAQSTQLKDRITLYCWPLYDFREGIRRHIDLDERIFETLLGSISIENITGEHETIKKQLDDAIRLAENAIYNELHRGELNKCALDIGEAVKMICESIGAHIAEEDRLLKQVQKGS